jgi:hypothetical protein
MFWLPWPIAPMLLLMTKFGKFGKTGISDLPFRNIQFWQFQNKTKEGAKLEDLKI